MGEVMAEPRELPNVGEWSLADIRAHIPAELKYWSDRALTRLCNAYEAAIAKRVEFEAAYTAAIVDRDEAIALKDKANEICMAIGFEHNQVIKQRDEARAACEQIKQSMRTDVSAAVTSALNELTAERAKADSLELMAESYRLKLLNLVNVIVEFNEDNQSSRNALRKAIVEAHAALEGK